MAIAHARSHTSADTAQRYWEGMDKSMPSKLALMAGLMLLDEGATVVDAGCGSGAAAYYLARLNPHVRVIGIDLDPVAVEACRAKHQLPNLTFEAGDVSKPLPFKADAILSSSTLHHVFAFSSPAYDQSNVAAAIEAHADSLNDNGILAVRDFVIPDNPDRIVLLNFMNPGATTGSDAEVDEATLLERFSEAARPLDSLSGPGFPLEELTPMRNIRRFRLSLQTATEFLLRKDYRADWKAELHEQYGYYTAAEFAAAFRAAGLGDVRTVPVHNHWIIKNRWENKVALTSEERESLPWPATNLLISGRKIASGAVQVKWKRTMKPAGYLKTSHWRLTSEGSVWTVAERPHKAIEILPFVMVEDGRLRVLARDGHPRPLATAADTLHPGRSIEPIAYAADTFSPLEALAKSGIQTELVAGDPVKLLQYMPSAGGIAEMVESWAVPLKALPARMISKAPHGMTRGAIIRSFDAKDILLAAQAGALDEGRLEIGTAALMRRHGIKAEPWTGEKLAITDGTLEVDLWTGSQKDQRYYQVDAAKVDASYDWMAIRRGLFQDVDRKGTVLGSAEIEWAEPRSGLPVSASLLPILRDRSGKIFIGLERRSLPAAQILTGSASLACVPAWRLPMRFNSVPEARLALAKHLGIEPEWLLQLGGSYFSSLGVTTERVFPFAIEMSKAQEMVSHAIALDDLLADPQAFQDGHLLVSAYRAAQLLGVL